MFAEILFLSIIFATVHFTYKRWSRISISHIPGPVSKSFLYGNLPELLQAQAGEADFKWQAMYGDVFRVRAPLGEDRLFISDPKALQYIYHTASYRFPKVPSRRHLSRILVGPGLSAMDGNDHRRQRKVMLPGFGSPESKSFLPIFFACAEKMAQKWTELMELSSDQSIVVNVTPWVSRAALDAIGEAAFDYQFGALDNLDNPLAKAYTNLMFDTFGLPTKPAILSLSIMDNLPYDLAGFIMGNSRSARLVHAHKTNKLSTVVAKDLVMEKSKALLEGDGRRDIMSMLVKANASENPKKRLDQKELLAQMNTIILGGHETTSNSISFALLEMCRKPQMQGRLRKEIRATEQVVRERGDSSFLPSDFESMSYLSAMVKETFRYHPVVYNIFRYAHQDDVLPLSTPITTSSGKVMHELPIPKGTQIIASIAAYNRNKEIFGDDADIFNPDRWLRDTVPNTKSALGVYASMFTFSGGSRSCIGWRFAVMELHAFMIELLRTFEFSLDDNEEVRRESTFVMTPTVEGQIEKGSQLRLKVKLAARDE
ncbi:cytochrome P450 [Armillaria borealis]|uniref:Cytochrome P450 n=1 Tax=Armillaria borealis TaxID=47425 RepID=A0AA39J7M8_9AGAR|nr:cytochrome P450 [Armillaria borealis]